MLSAHFKVDPSHELKNLAVICHLRPLRELCVKYGNILYDHSAFVKKSYLIQSEEIAFLKLNLIFAVVPVSVSQYSLSLLERCEIELNSCLMT